MLSLRLGRHLAIAHPYLCNMVEVATAAGEIEDVSHTSAPRGPIHAGELEMGFQLSSALVNRFIIFKGAGSTASRIRSCLLNLLLASAHVQGIRRFKEDGSILENDAK